MYTQSHQEVIESASRLSHEREQLYAAVRGARQVTPLHRIKNILVANENVIWAKEEYLGNPTQSAFDRVYPELFYSLEARGLIVPGVTPVIECSVGNAGASFAWAAQSLGYCATVIVNSDTPRARIEQINSFGAKIIFSPPGEYGTGYVKLLNRILAEDRAAKGGEIGENPARMFAVTKILPEARQFYRSLAEEAAQQLQRQSPFRPKFQAFVSAVGSGDLISGVGSYFRSRIPDFRNIAIEPAELPALSALRAGKVLPFREVSIDQVMIGVTGSGVGADRLNIDFSIIDSIEPVTIADWQSAGKLLLDREGKDVGRTSAGAFAAALRMSRVVSKQNILIVFYDAGWKYRDTAPFGADSTCAAN